MRGPILGDGYRPFKYKTTPFRATAYDQVVLYLRVLANQLSEAPARSMIMAKGQLRSNKETKKPKKPKQVVVPMGSIIPPSKAAKPAKPQH